MKKLTILVAQDDERLLAELVDRHPFATAHAVARIALHLGLEVLQQLPERLVGKEVAR